MGTFLLLLGCVTTMSMVAVAEDNGWVWNDGDQAQDKSDRFRYQVNEKLEDFNGRPQTGFRPQNQPFYGPNGRPIVPAASYPGNKDVLVGPGGPAGIIKRPPYGGNIDESAITSGYVPSWIREDPRYRDYDVCRCRYSFNCPSSGLKFGSCSGNKKYCCFSSRKYPQLIAPQYGGQYPAFGGAPNQYGPATFAQRPNYYGNRRPQGVYGSGNRYPGNYYYPGTNTNPYTRPYSNPDESNYDYNDYDVLGRSLKNNETENASGDEKA